MKAKQSGFLPERNIAEEHMAYSSQDWDGELENGFIVDRGTRGWCISLVDDAVFHCDSGVIIYYREYDADEEPIRLHPKDLCFQSFN